MEKKAEVILNKHVDANLNEIEMLVTDENRRDIFKMYRDYLKMGLSPNIEERNNQYYLITDIRSKLTSSKNVIDISIKKSRMAQVIEVDFESREVVKR